MSLYLCMYVCMYIDLFPKHGSGYRIAPGGVGHDFRGIPRDIYDIFCRFKGRLYTRSYTRSMDQKTTINVHNVMLFFARNVKITGLKTIAF